MKLMEALEKSTYTENYEMRNKSCISISQVFDFNFFNEKANAMKIGKTVSK